MPTTIFAFIAALTFFPGLLPARDNQGEFQFPFPVEVDKEAGKTGDYPNRVRHKNTGQWFVLVPAGKYRIGFDKHFDSKPIEVTLAAFYLGEERLTSAVAAQILEKAFREADDIDKEYVPLESQAFADLLAGRGKCPKEILKLPAIEREIFLLSSNYIWITGGLFGGLFEDHPIFRLPEKDMLRFVEKVKLIKAIRDETEQLQEIRKEVRVFCLEYEKKFHASMAALRQKGKTPYQPANFGHAAALAEKAGLRLPTEAQWEVAARLHAAKKLRLEGLFDGTLEFCSDYYAYDYFHRQKDFDNPIGPKRGKVTSEQVSRSSSGLGISSSLRTRNFHVLRGADPAARFYGYSGDLWENLKGLRLAFQP